MPASFMKCEVKKLPKGEAEIRVELAPDEVKPYLENAAKELSKVKPVEGYRPGNAPYDAVKRAYGEMAIYEAAIEPIVRKTYVQAVLDHQLNTYDEPRLDVQKLAPGNPIAYVAKVSLVPAVTKLPELASVKIKRAPQVIAEAKVDEAVKELQKMRTKEAAVNREVQDKDKVTVDMDMSRGGVPLEGGQARDHGIYLDEEYYIPGLKPQLFGMKAGEQKKFTLRFPAEHFQKHLAGQDVDFAVTLKQVFELQHPTLDDEFAKALGQESITKLRELIRQNMQAEADEKEAERVEHEALDKLVEKARFEDIPDAIVNREIDRMIHEMEHELEHRNVKLDDYLKNLKKTLADIKLDFAIPALKRVKAALLVRAIGEKEKIEATDADLIEETNRLINHYADNAEAQTQVRSDDYQEYLRTSIRNRKVVELMRQKCVE